MENLNERIKSAVNKKLCKKGEAYRKRRMAAGEKSSAYLSGRAVKVCKGQISGRKKKKTNESYLEENFEISSLAKELANAVEDKLEDKKDELNEVVDPISVLSTVLAGTTLTNILAKYIGKLFKKYNFGNGEAAAKNIESFTHKLENDFKGPIKRVVGLFTKDEKSKSLVTNSLYALLILGLGLKAGGSALQSLSKGNISAGTISGLKAALKGKDLSSLLKDIASAAT
jgi:hypothetical protein